MIDNDEVILPKINDKLLRVKDNFELISKLKFSSDLKVPELLTELETSCSTDANKLDNYLSSINKKSVTYHFSMGFYLKERQVRQIVETFEAHFKSFAEIKFKNASDIYKVIVVDSEPQSSNHNAYNFTFVFKNKVDIDYAVNLCRIYRSFIEKFKKWNKNKLDSNRFHRFFYIGGLLSSFACG